MRGRKTPLVFLSSLIPHPSSFPLGWVGRPSSADGDGVACSHGDCPVAKVAVGSLHGGTTELWSNRVLDRLRDSTVSNGGEDHNTFDRFTSLALDATHLRLLPRGAQGVLETRGRNGRPAL